MCKTIEVEIDDFFAWFLFKTTLQDLNVMDLIRIDSNEIHNIIFWQKSVYRFKLYKKLGFFGALTSGQ